MVVTLANESRCEEFKAQFAKFDYLWKNDLQATLKQFIADNGATLPDGTKDDPPLARFEEQVGLHGALDVAGPLNSFATLRQEPQAPVLRADASPVHPYRRSPSTKASAPRSLPSRTP